MNYFEFFGLRGCLMVFLHIVLLIYAILCLVAGIHIRFAYLVLVGEALDIVVYIIYRRVTRRNWNRPNSYWSNKEENSTLEKDS